MTVTRQYTCWVCTVCEVTETNNKTEQKCPYCKQAMEDCGYVEIPDKSAIESQIDVQ